MPREWKISVKRGETLDKLARWSGTDKQTLWQDNREVLPRRKWLKPSDKLTLTMSPNQKLAFDQSRERFHNRRLERYFSTRYIEKVVKYRVKRGDFISKVARRFGNVPMWLLTEFNQTDFRSIQPGDIVLIPVIAKVDREDQLKGQLAPDPEPPPAKETGASGEVEEPRPATATDEDGGGRWIWIVSAIAIGLAFALTRRGRPE